MFRKMFLLFGAILLLTTVSAADFSSDTFVIRSVSDKGSDFSSTFKIINSGDGQDFSVRSYSKEGFIFVGKQSFFLDSGKSEDIEVNLNSENLEEGVFTGEIVVEGVDGEIKIPVILEVQTPFPLFDSSIDARERTDDNYLTADVTFHKLKGQSSLAYVEYILKDIKGEIIFVEKDNLFVETQLQITKTFALEETFTEAKVFSVLVRDENNVSVGTSSFLILPQKENEKNDFVFVIAFVLIVLLIIIVILLNHFWSKNIRNKTYKMRKEVSALRKGNSQKIARLNYQRAVLEKAFKSGYITKKSYDESKKRIDVLIRKNRKLL